MDLDWIMKKGNDNFLGILMRKFYEMDFLELREKCCYDRNDT